MFLAGDAVSGHCHLFITHHPCVSCLGGIAQFKVRWLSLSFFSPAM
jgi:tRNA(Arg) A34 adenosine deaminase TadA